MNIFHPLDDPNINDEDICLVDNATTHIILKKRLLLQY